MSFLRRQILIAALTANALRPPGGQRAGIPAFLAGWLFGETAPQMLALTALDTATQLLRGRRTSGADRLALGLAGASALGLAHLVRQSQQVKDRVEDALVEGLGVDYVEQLDAPPSPADLAVPWRRLAKPFDHRTEGIRVLRDLPYSEAGRRGMLDIYLPRETPERAPVLLQVHGGAWILGRKDQQGQPLMTHLAARGWVCVAINYRLAPRDPWPAHIIDVKRAIAWVKQHVSQYGGDPDYVAITGGSAGGHLAALAALTPGDPAFQPGFEDADTSVRAAVPFYGVYDFAGATGLPSAETMRDTFLATRVLQRPWTDAPHLYEAASPLLRVTSDAPDFFVIHGALDSLVPVDQARLFVEALRRTSRRSVVYAELPGAQHAFDVFHSIRGTHVVRAVDRYLNWHWNTWRHGLPVDADVEPEDISDERESA